MDGDQVTPIYDVWLLMLQAVPYVLLVFHLRLSKHQETISGLGSFFQASLTRLSISPGSKF